MKAPLDYGDNFPVTSGSWDPTVPWRFPNQTIRLKQPSLFQSVLPWLMLGVGVALGVVLMGWKFGTPTASAAVTPAAAVSESSKQQLLPQWDLNRQQPVGNVQKRKPTKTRSDLV
jgi:hypothetical protein